MKQKMILACVALLMASCNAGTYYQVVDVKSTNLQKESNNYVYNDGVCKIVYNFWRDGGNAGFSIENLSDDVIYVDLANTFLIVNGWAYDYYKARNYGVGKSFQVATGKSAGMSTGLSASATAYGMWRGGALNGYPGSISAQASSVTSSQVSSSISEASSSNLQYAEKPIVAIPPQASKSFFEYVIMDDVIQDCSVNLKVKKGQSEGKTYTASESPINFINYITYKKGENGATKVFTNNFFLAGYKNYNYKDVIKKTKVGCKETVRLEYFELSGADRFYVKYNTMHNNYYSKDARTAEGK